MRVSATSLHWSRTSLAASGWQAALLRSEGTAVACSWSAAGLM